MAQRVGAFERQSVHCEFVGGFGTESVDVGGQSVGLPEVDERRDGSGSPLAAPVAGIG